MQLNSFIRLSSKFWSDQNRTECPLPRNAKRESLWGLDWCTDPHWRPQAFSCGLSEYINRFSFLGTLDKIEHQSRQLLKAVGLWEIYGKYYHWDINEKDRVGIPPPQLISGDKLIGFQQRPRTAENETGKHSHHSTHSRSKLSEYYTDDLLHVVKRIYSRDYELWNLLKGQPEMSSGSELAVKLSPHCAEKALLLARGQANK